MIDNNPNMVHKMGNGDIVASLDFMGKICCRFYKEGRPFYIARSLDGNESREFSDKSSYRRISVG